MKRAEFIQSENSLACAAESHYRRRMPTDSAVIAEQQGTADLYVRAGVIKTTLDVTPSFDAQFTAH